MFHRALTVAAVLLGMAVLLQAGQPGEKAKGPEFKTKGFTLVWGKLKSSAEVDFADNPKSKFTLQLEGSMEVPAKGGLDVVAVDKRFQIKSLVDDKGADITFKAASTGGTAAIHNAIIEQVGQVELPKTELSRDASGIAGMTVEAVIVLAQKRENFKLPAAVMEDFKDVGNGISVRINSLQMKANRELTVVLDYKRPDATTTSPFIEKIYALDPQKNVLGGGRWTEGDPFGQTGKWTAKFKLAGDQVHQSLRFDVVTQSEARSLSFEVKKIFKR
jgi:hypothetical protein